ncbi:DNA-directed DNA polymerase delta subunit [Martiniozyma asiatica (nom. inval.)]|nr:DNA-directed DNA polymerase delta subunit [Martiniozyma asiatica]
MTTDIKFRPTPSYSIRDTTFENPALKRNYTSQFNNIYKYRSTTLKPRIFKLAHQKWTTTTINNEKPVYISKILDVQAQKACFMIGTIFCEMKYKPDVLKEVELAVQGHSEILNDEGLSKLEILRRKAYSDPAKDEIWLEDESGRILITGWEGVLVTGLVVGVLGMEIESGVFHVVDVMFPEAAPQSPLPTVHSNDKKNVLIVSGFNINEESDRLKLELLKQWIMGDLGDPKAQEIESVYILGNLTWSLHKKRILNEKQKYAENFNSTYDKEAISYIDDWISQVCHSCPVTIMPGDSDVVEKAWPKQPIHHSLLPQSTSRNNFTSLTNPSWINIENVRMLATSGENVADITRYIIPNLKSNGPMDESIYQERLGLLEDMMLWQNIAPTAPDTLWCYPYEDSDPFTLKETPHIYVVGNQPKFESSLVYLKRKDDSTATVRVLAVPEFSESGQCVILNAATQKCHLLNII